ncbi:MAG: type II secretion system ATPase GspE [Marinobacterium sp.]|nr:type II secretion system ATPase GspE [Marinobacterium sp.]
MSETLLLPWSFANRHQLLVIEHNDGVELYYSEQTPALALAEVARSCPAPSLVTQLEPQALQDQLSTRYQSVNGGGMDAIQELDEVVDLDRLGEEAADLMEGQDDAPIIRLLNGLFTEALNLQASDIHIESFEQSMSIRLRVDGVLKEIMQPGHHVAPLLVSRIKVMAKLDIAEKRLPQDGRVSLKIAGRALDVRVSTLPSIHGERVVMRLLDKQGSHLELSHLGMPEDTEQRLRDLLAQPNGIILVTGPTGSGKTTTLYAALSQLNDRLRNIMTVEDPIEYALDGVGQTQVNSKTGMTFARGLRAILRQDPDIVMIGEIRDSETAQIAVQASLTGHLVLSTLHTNSAIATITRLSDIGIEPFLLASTLKGVLAQRLVRKLCPHCKSETTLSAEQARLLEEPEHSGAAAYEACGCSQCSHTGYKGRLGLYELLTIDADIKRMIHDRAGEHQISQQLRGRLRTMTDEGRNLVLQGVTSADEILRTVREAGDGVL